MHTRTWTTRAVAVAAIVAAAVSVLVAQARTQSQLYEDGLALLNSRGDARGAITLFEKAAVGPDKRTAARAVYSKGLALEKLGQQQARQQYELVISKYPEQTDVVAEALARLAAIARASPTARPAAPTLGVRRTFSRLPADAESGQLGAVSRDGRLMAYSSSGGEIALVEIAAPESSRILVKADAALSLDTAVPSPDGTAILAQWKNKQNGTDLRLSRPGGPATTILSVGPGDAIVGVEWPSRDQVLVQVEHADRRATLYAVNPQAPSARQVATLPTVSMHATLSADGRWAVYDQPTPANGSRDLFLVDTRSGRESTLVDDPWDDNLPVWSARGDYVLFVSDRTGSTSLWGVPMNAGTKSDPPRPFYPDLGRIVAVLGVTADGAYHYLRQTGLVDVYTVTLGADGRPEGEPVGAARRFIGSNMGPSFSPDGRTLAFLAEMAVSTHASIGLRDLTRNTQRTIATGMRNLLLPLWSPDGSRLLVRGYDTVGHYGFHLVDPQNGATVPLFVVEPDMEDSLGLGRWSPDGLGVFYPRQGGGRSEMRRIDVQTGVAETVFTTDKGSSISGFFDVARQNGAMVMAVNTRDTRPPGDTGPPTSSWVIVVREPGGELREIARFPGPELVNAVAWSADGRSIWFLRTTKSAGDRGATRGIWRMTADGGDKKALGVEVDQKEEMRALAVSPDGRHLAFTAGSPTREPWVLEHFLPEPAAPARRDKH